MRPARPRGATASASGAWSRSAASISGVRNGRSPATQTTASTAFGRGQRRVDASQGPAAHHAVGNNLDGEPRPWRRIVRDDHHARERAAQESQLTLGNRASADVDERLWRCRPCAERGPPATIAAATTAAHGQGVLARRATPCRMRIIWSCRWPLLARIRPVSPSKGPPSRSVTRPPAPSDDGGAGDEIPRVQRAFPVAVEPTARDEAEVQRRRTQAARPLRRRRQRGPFGQVVLHGITLVREAGDQQRAAQTIDARRDDRLAVERRAAARDRAGERPAERRRFDDAQHGATVDAQPERHRKQRHAVREVGRAVERIDVPDAQRAGRVAAGRAFLADDAVLRERGRQPLDDQRLRAPIVFGDQVDVFALERDRWARPPPLQQELAGLTRDLDRDLTRPLEGIAQGTIGLARHRSQLLAHPRGVLRTRQHVLGRRRDGGVDVFAIDGREAELLAEVALSAVGDQVQVAHALRARACWWRFRPADSPGPRRAARGRPPACAAGRRPPPARWRRSR